MVGLLLAELGGQCMKVIPQRDDLGWHAGAKQRDRLSRNGGPGRSRLVEEIAADGQTFDPSMHEAISEAPGEANKVVSVVQKGYRLGERVIRPAMVIVGKGSESGAEARADDDE